MPLRMLFISPNFLDLGNPEEWVWTSRGVQMSPRQLEIVGFETFCEGGIYLGQLRGVWIPTRQINLIQAHRSSQLPCSCSLPLRDAQGFTKAGPRFRHRRNAR